MYSPEVLLICLWSYLWFLPERSFMSRVMLNRLLATFNIAALPVDAQVKLTGGAHELYISRSDPSIDLTGFSIVRPRVELWTGRDVNKQQLGRPLQLLMREAEGQNQNDDFLTRQLQALTSKSWVMQIFVTPRFRLVVRLTEDISRRYDSLTDCMLTGCVVGWVSCRFKLPQQR